MCWASLKQVGRELEQMVAAQVFPSLERALGICFFTRARVCALERVLWIFRLLFLTQLPLERAFLRSSEPCVMCLFARASSLALERASASLLDLKVGILRSSELS